MSRSTERVLAAVVLTAVSLTATESLLAGPVQIAPSKSLVNVTQQSTSSFALHETGLILLSLADYADTVFPDVLNSSTMLEQWDVEAEARVTGAFGGSLCGHAHGGATCGPLCTLAELDRMPYGSMSGDAGQSRTVARKYDTWLPPLATHDVVVWRNQVWASSKRIGSEMKPSFSPDAPSVPLPRGLLLGVLGLVILVVMRARFGPR